MLLQNNNLMHINKPNNIMSLKATEKYGVPVTATNKEFLTIFQTLQETKAVRGIKYATIVVKNCGIIEQHLKELEAMAMPSEDFVILSQKAQAFIGAEDEEGLKALEAEHVDVIEARKAQLAGAKAKRAGLRGLEGSRRADKCSTLERWKVSTKSRFW